MWNVFRNWVYVSHEEHWHSEKDLLCLFSLWDEACNKCWVSLIVKDIHSAIELWYVQNLEIRVEACSRDCICKSSMQIHIFIHELHSK